MWKWLVFVGWVVGCSGSSTGGGTDVVQGKADVAAVVNAEASFASVGSDEISRAAMAYPATVAAEAEAPMSLTAADGTGLALTALEGRAVVDGPLAFTELRMTFANPRDRVIEGRFQITLPEDAAISRLAMKIDGRWQEAEVVEKQLARRAYEDFLHRQQDPALMEKEAGNQFRARIFPIPANETKEIIVSYSHELTSAEELYRLPLRGLPKIDRLSITALRAGETTSFEKRGYKPTADFEVAQPAGVRGVASGELAVVRVAPKLAARPEKLDRARILFDTSASRAPGFARQVKRLGELIAKLAASHPGLAIEVTAFDQSISVAYRGPAAGFDDQALDVLRARRPLGASDLGGALAALESAPAYGRLIVVTDAVATAGPTEASEIAGAARDLPGLERIDVVLVGGIRDSEAAGSLARGVAKRDGVVLDGDGSTAAIAARLGKATVSGIDVTAGGAAVLWPRRLDGVQPGDEAMLYVAGTGPLGDDVTIRLGGAIDQKIRVPLTRVERPLVERALARAQIAALASQRDRLPVDDTNGRDALKKKIVELSTRHRVVSDFTALLVLETEQDYERFDIDRKALADILTVGKGGVVRTARGDVVLIADGPPRPDDSAGKKEKKKKGRKDADEPGEMFGSNADGKLDPEETLEVEGRATGRDQMDRPVDRAGEDDAAEAEPEAPAPARRPGPTDERPPADVARSEPKPTGPPPLTGKLASVMQKLAVGQTEAAAVEALAWQSEEAGNVMALIALGEALEARGQLDLAARVYGSIIDLFPSRADMRRMAAQRLERLTDAAGAAALAVDSLTKAAEQRPDHLTGHRQLAYALVRAGRIADAFVAVEAGLEARTVAGRFPQVDRILREDLGILAAAWIAREPARRAEIEKRTRAAGAKVATTRTTRFVLSWETDANDVDFHIYDASGNHAFYQQKELASGGALYHDVTNGYGPECFAIDGTPAAGPYKLRIHYYSRGPMGYGMGELEVLEHDGKGTLDLETRPFVVMNDGAYVELGTVKTN